MKSALPGVIISLMLALGLAGAAEARTVKAVASFTLLADVVAQVGGDRVAVTSLVGRNGDPHAYEPTPDDARRLKEADVVFINGLGIEGWMPRLVRASGFAGRPVVVSDGIRPLTMEEDGKALADPHVWNDPSNGIVWVRNIVKALSEADPQDAAVFRANGERYIAELRAIDAYARARFEAIPKERRKLLISHDAFGYFGHAYGIVFLAPQGFSTEAAASAATLSRLINQIRKEKVKAYFLENSNDPRLVRQIARATGAQPGGTLYVESLSAPDGPAPTYAKMLRTNIDLVAAALGGKLAPGDTRQPPAHQPWRNHAR